MTLLWRIRICDALAKFYYSGIYCKIWPPGGVNLARPEVKTLAASAVNSKPPYSPYEKRSKKEQRKRDARRRTTWGALNPVTRKPENSKAYDRQKARKWSDDSASVPLLMG